MVNIIVIKSGDIVQRGVDFCKSEIKDKKNKIIIKNKNTSKMGVFFTKV